MVKGQPDVQNLCILSHLPDCREGQPLNIGAQTAYVLCKGLGKHVYALLHQVTGCLCHSLSVLLRVCITLTKPAQVKFWLQQVHVPHTFCHFSVRAAESLHIKLTKAA